MSDLIPIVLLLAVVGVVVSRLPKIELGFSEAFRRRRVANWLPLGLSYAFLYMARYNLNAVKTVHVLSEHSYGTIYAVGAACYGISFFVNGPLTDRFGGRRAILLATSGSGLMNLLMGLAARSGRIGNEHVGLFEVLFGLNMYFQSFGAVAIIKVNSAWFHVRERGVFGGIFGILISLGLYFAFDWCLGIAKSSWPIEWVFFVPSAICFTFFAICFGIVRATPADAGHADFDTADASSGDSAVRLPVTEVLHRMLTNKVVMTIAAIEFCSGFLRDSIMHWYRDFAGALGGGEAFVAKNWGMLLCIAGIMGGTFAGILSDRFFDSRRPPVAAVLYTIMLAGALALMAAIAFPVVSGWIVIVMVMSVIGVHGVLSGTASADFGGKKNAGVATGIIDGFVYAGTATQSYILGRSLPEKGTALAALPESWRVWPIAMLPIAALGLFLATRVWNAKPKPKEALPTMVPPVMGHPEGVSKAARRGSRETQPKILDQVLALAQSAGKDGVVAFDLDSTLLDNRSRQALLLREWATQRGGPEAITRTKPEHLDGWDLRVAMVNAGLPRAEAEAVYADAKNFWRERFFTSEYCKLDVPIAGAVAYVEKLRATGVQIVYLTGRHEAMRAGTVESFVTAGFPVPDDKTIRLFMKPTLEQDDDAWKVEAKARLRPLGKMLAAFDNEPIHINGYKESFPDTFAVHLDTDSSGRPVAVLESIPSVLDFQL